MNPDQSSRSGPVWKRPDAEGEPGIPQPDGSSYSRYYGGVYRRIPQVLAILVLLRETDLISWFSKGAQLALPWPGTIAVVVFGLLTLAVDLLAWRMDAHPGPAWLLSLTKALRTAALPLIAGELFLLLVFLT